MSEVGQPVRGQGRDATPSGLDAGWLTLLVCPVSRQPLRHDGAAGELVADVAGLAYPIRDGVPVLLPEAARRLRGD